MAHGVNSVLKKDVAGVTYRNDTAKGVGSRRIFAPHFKLQVLDSYRNDADCKGNQRATARKYGIHRRQIQKWLQAENTLRNSVSNIKEKVIVDKNLNDNRKSCNGFEMALNANRQRDDERASGIESRVPALTQSSLAASYSSPSLPLDYTIHQRFYTASPIVARSDSSLAAPYHSLPIDLSFKRPNSVMPESAPVCCMTLSPQISLSSPEYQPDVWDLSTKKNDLSSDLQTQFQIHTVPETKSKPIKLFKPYLDDLNETINSTTTKKEPCHAVVSSKECFDNSSNICNVKTEYMNKFTLHELKQTSVNYFYSPDSEYEVGFCCYEDIGCSHYLGPIKQKHLRTNDSYFYDTDCKRNITTEYNVHRQIPKWSKQADELRLQNEYIKHPHAVR